MGFKSGDRQRDQGSGSKRDQSWFYRVDQEIAGSSQREGGFAGPPSGVVLDALLDEFGSRGGSGDRYLSEVNGWSDDRLPPRAVVQWVEHELHHASGDRRE